MSDAAIAERPAHASQVERRIWRLLEEVADPEIPVLSVVDLGLIRYIQVDDDERIAIGVSPTYTGCPATDVIRAAIEAKVQAAGYADVRVEAVMAPAWTSDWLSERGKEKLREYGIAPPAQAVSSPRGLFRDPIVQCPRCASRETERVSEFGSTPCKALYRCAACAEPFEYFKCI